MHLAKQRWYAGKAQMQDKSKEVSEKQHAECSWKNSLVFHRIDDVQDGCDHVSIGNILVVQSGQDDEGRPATLVRIFDRRVSCEFHLQELYSVRRTFAVAEVSKQ